MRTSLGLGTWRGVPIRAHLSLVLFLPLLVFLFATRLDTISRFPGGLLVEPSGLGVLDRAVLGSLIAVGLFGSVLLHEMGHAGEAARHGVKTRDITLWIFGGIARLERLPDRPRVEAAIALAGPVVSFVLGAAGTEFGRLVPIPAAAFAIRYLGLLNITLALFNLIPAFPLDGGRLLRAQLAHRWGILRATRVAVDVGRAFAVVLALAGLFGNPFLILIALFIYMAGTQERAGIEAREMLRRVPLLRIVERPDTVLPADAAVDVAIGAMMDRRLHALPARGDDGRLGVVTLEALVGVPHEQRPTRRVRDVGIVPVPTMPSTGTGADALDALLADNHPAVFVSDGAEPPGIITREGLSRALALMKGGTSRPS